MSPLGHCVFSDTLDKHGLISAHTRAVYFSSDQQLHQEFGPWVFSPAQGRRGQSCCCATPGRPLSPAQPSQNLSPQPWGAVTVNSSPVPLCLHLGKGRSPRLPCRAPGEDTGKDGTLPGGAQPELPAPRTLPGPPCARDSSPSLYLLDGGRSATPTAFWPLEGAACSSLAGPWDFFRDRAWLSQSSSSSLSGAPCWEARVPLAGVCASSGAGFAPEEGSPAGAECRPTG